MVLNINASTVFLNPNADNRDVRGHAQQLQYTGTEVFMRELTLHNLGWGLVYCYEHSLYPFSQVA